jgi:hypothetical protein
MAQNDLIHRAGNAGMYSHIYGARYIHPSFSGFKYPDLTELHESHHELLALSNRVDTIARVYAPLLDPKMLKGEILPPQIESKVREIIGVIIKNTLFTHEVIATYFSFSMFIAHYPKEYEIARKELP